MRKNGHTDMANQTGPFLESLLRALKWELGFRLLRPILNGDHVLFFSVMWKWSITSNDINIGM
jgi:hypothetical protein